HAMQGQTGAGGRGPERGRVGGAHRRAPGGRGAEPRDLLVNVREVDGDVAALRGAPAAGLGATRAGGAAGGDRAAGAGGATRGLDAARACGATRGLDATPAGGAARGRGAAGGDRATAAARTTAAIIAG